jgi:hypothetical protein
VTHQILCCETENIRRQCNDLVVRRARLLEFLHPWAKLSHENVVTLFDYLLLCIMFYFQKIIILFNKFRVNLKFESKVNIAVSILYLRIVILSVNSKILQLGKRNFEQCNILTYHLCCKPGK